MNLIMPVYVVLAATNVFYARILRWLMNSRYNHAMLVFFDELWESWWAVEVDERGVRLAPLETLKNRYGAYVVYVPEGNMYCGLRGMLPYVGRKYDWKALFNGVWLYFRRKFTGRTDIEKFESVSRYMCSEFVTEFLQKAGVKGTEELVPSLVSPAMLQEHFESSGAFVHVQNPPFEL